MRKSLLLANWILLGFATFGQSPRLSLYEEFTGENCPPCAATNPALNVKLANNYSKIAAIKWQVPIPSAPTATWSLYKTNQAEIDWRYREPSLGGYGYESQNSSGAPITGLGVNSAPSGRIDGQHQWVFGAASDHPANVNNTVFSTAQSYTSAFSITMTRAWNATGSAITLTVNIQATAPFTAVGPLIFRTVMVERLIVFPAAPGSNGEKEFEDVAIKSFPTLQAGIPMAGNWIVGQTQTFTLTCPIPAYVRKKDEIAFVGFIQDDGDKKVAQAARAEKEKPIHDAVAVSARVGVTCISAIDPEVTIYNNGSDPITSMTITPSSDGTTGPVTTWAGNLASGASTTIPLNQVPVSSAAGSHLFSYSITATDAPDFELRNNTGKVTYLVVDDYQTSPVAEGFAMGAYPPAGFTVINPNGGTAGWSRSILAGAYHQAPLHSTKYDFFNNDVIGDKDEFYLPPVNLAGSLDPEMYFDLAYAPRNANSNDALEVLASDDCGATWTSIFSTSGANMATAPATLSAYIPNLEDPTEWRTEQFSLPGFNKPDVLIKFVVTSDHGNNLYLDNINLAQALPNLVGISEADNSDVSVSLYPNPADDITTVSIQTKSSTQATMRVVNALGQLVYTESVNLSGGDNHIPLSVKEYASGLYYISIQGKGLSTVKKLSIH